MAENKNNLNFKTSDSYSIQSNDTESQQENETQKTRPPNTWDATFTNGRTETKIGLN